MSGRSQKGATVYQSHAMRSAFVTTGRLLVLLPVMSITDNRCPWALIYPEGRTFVLIFWTQCSSVRSPRFASVIIKAETALCLNINDGRDKRSKRPNAAAGQYAHRDRRGERRAGGRDESPTPRAD